jgi:hypothetical protein
MAVTVDVVTNPFIDATRWRIAGVLRSVAMGVLAGALAGLVAGGIGSRLAMRVVALVAGRRHYGEVTEAEAAVGAITVDGTIFLLFAGAVVGVSGGLVWMGLRRWLRPLGRWQGFGYGVLLLGLFGSAVLDADNVDFTRFGSPGFNVVLFSALFLAFGLLVVPLTDWLDRVLPPVPPVRPWRVRRLIGYGGLLVVGGVGWLPGLGGVLLTVIINPEFGGPAFGLVALGLVLTRWPAWSGIALAAGVAVGSSATLLAVGKILCDAYW